MDSDCREKASASTNLAHARTCRKRSRARSLHRSARRHSGTTADAAARAGRVLPKPCAAGPWPCRARSRRTGCDEANRDAEAASRSRPGMDPKESRPPLLPGGCGSRERAGSFPPRARWQDVRAIPGWGWPCRSRFWKCRCEAPASGPPTAAGSGGAHGESRAPGRPPADRPRLKLGWAGWSPAVGLEVLAPRYQGAGGIFCRESCWGETARACNFRSAALLSFPRSQEWLPSFGCGVPELGLRGAFLHRDRCYFRGNEP